MFGLRHRKVKRAGRFRINSLDDDSHWEGVSTSAINEMNSTSSLPSNKPLQDELVKDGEVVSAVVSKSPGPSRKGNLL